MKLSEAIRLGAMNRPQAFGAFEHRGGTCALGAACEAIGLSIEVANHAHISERLQSLFPVLRTQRVACPVCGRVQHCSLASLIADLNDRHRWTREAIADWVESQEALAEPVTVDAVGQRFAEPHLSTRAEGSSSS